MAVSPEEIMMARRATPWALTGRSVGALIVALLLACLLSFPILLLLAPVRLNIVFRLGQRPPDDRALVRWAQQQPGVLQFQAQRQGPFLVVRLDERGVVFPRALYELSPRLRQLGYQARYISNNPEMTLPMLVGDPAFTLTALTGTEVALLLVVLWRFRRRARRRDSLRLRFEGPPGRAIAIGLATGLSLLALGALYDLLLKVVSGHAPPNFWHATAGYGPMAAAGLLLLGGCVAPVAEELFFRGYLFGQFRQIDRPVFGMAVTALLFAVAHCNDSSNLPIIFVFGLVLAWVYHRTGSLLTSITAHITNNTAAFLLLFLTHH